jgi:ABC-type phosphate/phosphonate transport system permease subunit
MLKFLYMLCATGASVVFLWLSYTGPPPPIVHQPDLPEFAPAPTFLLGNISFRRFDDHADALWDTLLPANKGAVLATNIASGFHLWARPAMFHQLQCLRTIRKEFVALMRSGAEARRFMSSRGPGSSYDNATYCFDYVRQVRITYNKTCSFRAIEYKYLDC